MYKGYLIDLDGTAYVGKTPVQATIDFTKRLQDKNIPFLFLTNNASKSNEKIANIMNDMGYEITADNIYTSANATVDYIADNYNSPNIYVIGTEDLKNQVEEQFNVVEDKADIVVVGLNDNVTYQDIAKACILVQNGADLISTNPDLVIPNENGNLPSNGLITMVIEKTTNTEALIIGKPEDTILSKAINKMKLEKKDVALIGDNYDTDIMCGLQNGIDAIYVQTGVTTIDEIMRKKQIPQHIIKDLNDWTEL